MRMQAAGYIRLLPLLSCHWLPCCQVPLTKNRSCRSANQDRARISLICGDVPGPFKRQTASLNLPSRQMTSRSKCKQSCRAVGAAGPGPTYQLLKKTLTMTMCGAFDIITISDSLHGCVVKSVFYEERCVVWMISAAKCL